MTLNITTKPTAHTVQAIVLALALIELRRTCIRRFRPNNRHCGQAYAPRGIPLLSGYYALSLPLERLSSERTRADLPRQSPVLLAVLDMRLHVPALITRDTRQLFC